MGNATAAIEGFQFLKKRCLRKSKTPDLSERAPNEHPTSFGLRGAHDGDDGDVRGDGGGDGGGDDDGDGGQTYPYRELSGSSHPSRWAFVLFASR